MTSSFPEAKTDHRNALKRIKAVKLSGLGAFYST